MIVYVVMIWASIFYRFEMKGCAYFMVNPPIGRGTSIQTYKVCSCSTFGTIQFDRGDLQRFGLVDELGGSKNKIYELLFKDCRR